MTTSIYIIGVGLIATLIAFFVQNAKKQVLPNLKAILFLIVFTIFLSLLGTIAYFNDFYNKMTAVILVQFISAGIGYISMMVWNKKFINSNPDYSKLDWLGVLFHVVVLLLSFIGFYFVFYYFNNKLVIDYYPLAILPYILPFFIAIAYKAYIAIPTEIHKLWFYPVYSNGIDTSGVDPDKALMLEFEYTLNNQSGAMNTKINAPVDMKFGDWFQAYIDYHNEKYTDKQIEYVSEDGTPQAWSFYEKPSVLGTPKYIDADLTILENKLSENKLIIAQRINTH